MEEHTIQNERKPKLRFRYRLRTLLLLLAIVPMILGVYISQLRAHQAAMTRVEAANGRVRYNYQLDRMEWALRQVEMAQAAAQGKAPPIYPAEIPPGPRWLRQLLGDDVFASVVEVELHKRNLKHFDLSFLSAFDKLHELRLRGPWTSDEMISLPSSIRLKRLSLSTTMADDKTLESLAEFSQLELLHLSSTGVTDEGMKFLGKLSNLKILSLNNTRVTDAGIAHLQRLSHIESIELYGTRTSREGIESLQRHLPRCRIQVEQDVLWRGITPWSGSLTSPF